LLTDTERGVGAPIFQGPVGAKILGWYEPARIMVFPGRVVLLGTGLFGKAVDGHEVEHTARDIVVVSPRIPRPQKVIALQLVSAAGVRGIAMPSVLKRRDLVEAREDAGFLDLLAEDMVLLAQ
jgi:hypothetical protein